MTLYLLINTGISLAVLLALRFFREAPPRLRVTLATIAMLLWMVPLHRLPWSLPVAEPLRLSLPAELTAPPIPKPEAPTGEATAVMGFERPVRMVPLLFSWSLVLGALLFALRFIGYLITTVRNRRRAGDGGPLRELLPEGLRMQSVPIRVLPGFSGAMTTGILRPVIWIGERTSSDETQRCLLIHEAIHVHRRDNAVLFLASLAQHLFWWNPLVHLLARQARFIIELDCDAACKRYFPSGFYQTQLAKLLLELQSRPVPRAHLATGIHNSDNLMRIRELERSYSMQTKHYAVALGLCAVTFLMLAQAGPAEPNPAAAALAGKQQPTEKKAYRGFPITHIDVKDQPAGDLLRFIADKVGLNLYIHPSVDDSIRVTYQFEKIPWDQVIDIVITDTDLYSEYSNGLLWVGTQEAAHVFIEKRNEASTRLRPLLANPVLSERYSGHTIDLQVENVSMKTVLAEIAQKADLNIYLHPEVNKTSATYNFTGIPWDQCLDIVLQNAGLTYRYAGHNLWVAPIDVYQRLGMPDQYPRYRGKKQDLDLRGTSLGDWLRSYAERFDLTIEGVDPSRFDRVVLGWRFEDTPWDQALDICLNNHGASLIVRGEVMSINPSR